MTDHFKNCADNALSSVCLSEYEKHRLAAQIMAEQPAKNKRKMSVVLAAITILLTALSSISMAGDLNIFGVFSNQNARLEKLLYSSAIKDPVPVAIETTEIGTSAVTLTNAHFDGQRLILGYSIENMCTVESFVPAEEELAFMRPRGLETICGVPWINEEQKELNDWYGRAVQAKYPFPRGLKAHEIKVSFVIPGENGKTHTLEQTQYQQLQNDGLICYLDTLHNTAYDPYISQLMKQDSITMEMRIYETTYLLWYDGSEQYARWINELITAVPVTVDKSGK